MIARSAHLKLNKYKKYGERALGSALLIFISSNALAVDSDWLGTNSADWFDPDNWSSGVPVDVAVFNTATPLQITINGLPSAIDTLQFNNGGSAYILDFSSDFSLNAGGIINNSGVTQTVNILAGSFTFANSASASDALITNALAANLYFSQDAQASMATISNNGTLDISGYTGLSPFSIGTLNSTGSIDLGANSLVIGGLNANMSIAGGITGTGSFTKVGNGELSLLGDNFSAGLTTVSAGTLIIASQGGIAGDISVAENAFLTIQGRVGNTSTLTNAGSTTFENLSNALNTTISNTGSLIFQEYSTAGNAIIANQLSGILGFADNAQAGTATITNAGMLQIVGDSFTTDATIINQSGATVDVSQHSAAVAFEDLGIGSLSGAGNVILGANQLTIGWLNTDMTISGIVSGENDSAFYKTGTGTLTLSGVNTTTGTVAVLQGQLTIAATGSIAGTLLVLETGSASILGSVGSVLLNGGNTEFSLNGTAGAATVTNAGTLIFTDTSTAGTSIITNGDGLTDCGFIGFAGTSTANTATVINNSTGILDISQHTAELVIGTLSGSGSVFLGANELRIGALNQNATISGVISDNLSGGSLTKQGSGVVTLSASNTYTGTTTVSAGTLALAVDGSLSVDSALVVSSGAVFDISQVTGEFVTLGDVSGAGTFSLGNKQFVVGTNVTDPTTRTISGVISDGGIGGGVGGALTKEGSGTLILSNINTYTGLSTISAGTLSLIGSGSISGGVSISAGTFDISDVTTSSTIASLAGSGGSVELGTKNLIVNTTASTSYAGTLAGTNGTNALTKTGSGVLTLTGDSSAYTGMTIITAGGLALSGSGELPGGMTINAGSFDISNVTTSATISSLIGSGGTVVLGTKNLIVNTSASTSYAGSITGSSASNALTKSGSGSLTLTANNSAYTGMTTVSAGTLALSTGGTLPGEMTVNGGSFDITLVTTSATIASLAGSGGTVALGTKNLIVNTSATTSYAGTISGTNTANALTKNGVGTLSLTGNNSSYTGMTTVNAGVLALANGGTLASSLTVNSGSFDISAVTTSATITSLTGSGGVVALGTKNLILNTSTSTNYMGTISGTNTTNALTKSGAGTLTLSANSSSYTGMTTVSAGTIALSGGGALPGGMTINAGSFNISSVTAFATISSLAGAGGTVVLGNKTLVVNTSLSTTYAGAITGSGGNLTKQNTGVLTLTSGAIDYTGTTNIVGGTLALSNAGILSSNSILVTGAAGTFDMSQTTASALTIGDVSGAGYFSLGNNDFLIGANINGDQTRTISGVMSDGGIGGGIEATVTKQGTGTLILTGENTYTGLTTVEAGTLQLGLPEGLFAYKSWNAGFTIAGDVTVNAGAFLIGYGSIGGTLNNFGTVAPGDGSTGGNLTVAGNYIQNPAGIFLADIDDAGVPSILLVGGQAQLNNGTFGINMVGTGYVVDQVYTAIIADGGIVGNFGTILQPDFIMLTVNYLSDEVQYLLTFGSEPLIAIIPNTPNQARVADYIVGTGADTAVIGAIIPMTTTQQVRVFLDSLSGATYANQQVALAKVGQSFETELADRIDGYLSCNMKEFRFPEESEIQERSCKGVSWWGVLYGEKNQIANTEVSGLRSYSTGGAIGTEILADTDMLVGLAVSYNHLHEVAFGREHAQVSGALYQFGVYGRQQWNKLRLGASLDYGMTNSISSTRDIITVSSPVPVSGNYKAKVLSAQVRTNYDLPIANEVGVRPLLGTIYQHVWQNAFTESGHTGFELAVQSAEYTSLRAQFGVDLELYTFGKFYPFASAIWEYEVADQFGEITAGLVGVNNTFYAVGTEIGRQALVVKAGFIVTKHTDWDLLLEYEGRYAENFMQRGIKMELSYF